MSARGASHAAAPVVSVPDPALLELLVKNASKRPENKLTESEKQVCVQFAVLCYVG